jgi:hypothetical protein
MNSTPDSVSSVLGLGCVLLSAHVGFRKEIRSATSSMTSVPKPLKFLRPHYGALKSFFETMPESELKVCVKC